MFLARQHRRLSRAFRTRSAALSRAKINILIAGPWIHIPWGDRIGAADFGAEALLDTDEILLRWFNHWLKDSGEFASEPKIRHFVLGENRWRKAERVAAPREIRALSAQRRQSKFAQRRWRCSRERRPQIEEPRDVFVYDPEVPVLAPGGPAALAGSSIRPRWSWATMFSSTRRSLSLNLLRIFGTPRVALLLLDVIRAYRLHRQARPRQAQRRGGVHLHRHRALELALCRIGIRRGQNSSLGVQSRAHVLQFRSRRTHSAGNRQQRLPALRSQSGHGRALSPRHFLGLEALHADSSITTAEHPAALYLPRRARGAE